ncbi:hypothetical protein GCM10022226_52900 [Sphaerisporangium flaviroseum]|uniref:Type VII secretion-associated protein n=1 Tax=Sphaerisporangium flaviroseum TaxID=509199 RepID=A0ABP7IS08_9ACTN
MSDHPSSARAWPFLVARGRRRGYRTLLAPDFLLRDRDYGVLDDEVAPSVHEDRPSVIEVVTEAGRPLTVVHATHLVTPADIAEPGTEPAAEAPRDEHSRPLQLMYGFVCSGGAVHEPDEGDLRACRESALATYRRFLGDEDGFAVEPGREFPLRSAAAHRPAPARRPVQAFSMTTPGATPGRDDRSGYHLLVRQVTKRRYVVSAVVGLLVIVIVTMMWPGRPKEPVKCDPVARTSVSQLQRPPGSPTPTPTPTPTAKCPTAGKGAGGRKEPR